MNRRSAVKLASHAAAIASLGLASSIRAQPQVRTPLQHIGPFYPVLQPADSDTNLTHRLGSKDRAVGQLLELQGQVLDLSGAPVPGAIIELWQANAAGRYRHPHDPNPAPLDPNFDGFARFTTDDSGRFAIKTIKPGAYPTASGAMRPPHIHFDIRSKSSRIITQMYFPGEPLNEEDPLYRSAGNRRERLLCAYSSGTTREETLTATWIAVIDNQSR
jgi:protocatechuate 3,4-dioxygenase, beta subunit